MQADHGDGFRKRRGRRFVVREAAAAAFAIVALVAISTVLCSFAVKPDTHCPTLIDASGRYDDTNC